MRKIDVTTKKKAEPERGTTRPAVREDRVEKKRHSRKIKNQEATSRKKSRRSNEAAAVGVRAGLAVVAWWSDRGVVVST
jgi:hypothetical protein